MLPICTGKPCMFDFRIPIRSRAYANEYLGQFLPESWLLPHQDSVACLHKNFSIPPILFWLKITVSLFAWGKTVTWLHISTKHFSLLDFTSRLELLSSRTQSLFPFWIFHSVSDTWAFPGIGCPLYSSTDMWPSGFLIKEHMNTLHHWRWPPNLMSWHVFSCYSEVFQKMI
jgi:hypothetical protein